MPVEWSRLTGLPDVGALWRNYPVTELEFLRRQEKYGTPRCTCRPSDGYHQHHCSISRRMRAELREAQTPPMIDPTKRAKVN